VYPRLYLWNDPDASIVEAAREANLQMPEYAVTALESRVGDLDGLNVLVLGAAYRGGVKETAFSGVFGVVANLESRGANVFVDDPLFSNEELTGLGFATTASWDGFDAAILQANHTEYLTLSQQDLPGVQVILDGRRWLDQKTWGHKLLSIGSLG
jgi:UDP-N-acetyl-D-mannosaminuronate dehydrogenase